MPPLARPCITLHHRASLPARLCSAVLLQDALRCHLLRRNRDGASFRDALADAGRLAATQAARRSARWLHPAASSTAMCLIYYVGGAPALAGVAALLVLQLLHIRFVGERARLHLRAGAGLGSGGAALAAASALYAMARGARGAEALRASDAFCLLGLFEALHAVLGEAPAAASALALATLSDARFTSFVCTDRGAAALQPSPRLPSETQEAILGCGGFIALIGSDAPAHLRSALTAELHRASAGRTPALRGVAFEGAQPLLLPTLTLRQNIALGAFGRTGGGVGGRKSAFASGPWAARYQAAVHATRLRQLFSRLPDGDNTLAADACLTQAQAQRIAMARACFAGARLTFLEAPLLALPPAKAGRMLAACLAAVRADAASLPVPAAPPRSPTDPPADGHTDGASAVEIAAASGTPAAGKKSAAQEADDEDEQQQWAGPTAVVAALLPEQAHLAAQAAHVASFPSGGSAAFAHSSRLSGVRAALCTTPAPMPPAATPAAMRAQRDNKGGEALMLQAAASSLVGGSGAMTSAQQRGAQGDGWASTGDDDGAGGEGSRQNGAGGGSGVNAAACTEEDTVVVLASDPALRAAAAPSSKVPSSAAEPAEGADQGGRASRATEEERVVCTGPNECSGTQATGGDSPRGSERSGGRRSLASLASNSSFGGIGSAQGTADFPADSACCSGDQLGAALASAACFALAAAARLSAAGAAVRLAQLLDAFDGAPGGVSHMRYSVTTVLAAGGAAAVVGEAASAALAARAAAKACGCEWNDRPAGAAALRLLGAVAAAAGVLGYLLPISPAATVPCALLALLAAHRGLASASAAAARSAEAKAALESTVAAVAEPDAALSAFAYGVARHVVGTGPPCPPSSQRSAGAIVKCSARRSRWHHAMICAGGDALPLAGCAKRE